MAETNGTEIKIFGVDSQQHDLVKSAYQEVQAEISEKAQSNLLRLTLSPERLAKVREVETAADEYILSKMRRLGVPENKLPIIPHVQYARKPKGEFRATGGFHSPISHMVVVFEREFGDFFDTLSVIAHEKSHASVSSEIRLYFPEDKTEDLTSATASGMEVIGNRQNRASAIEEGMVIFDQTDFFNTFIKNKFPDECNKRLKWAMSGELRRRELRNIDQTLYGTLTPDLIAPFVLGTGPTIPFIGISLYTPMLDTAEQVQLKEYLFTRKLCEIVGREASITTERSQIDTEEAIQIGRDILDKDRYLRTNEAHRKIVKVLGGKNAKALFQLRAHDPNIDNAMKILAAA